MPSLSESNGKNTKWPVQGLHQASFARTVNIQTDFIETNKPNSFECQVQFGAILAFANVTAATNVECTAAGLVGLEAFGRSSR